MSKFNWRNGFAVGLASGVAGTAVVLAWSDVLYDLVECVANQSCDSYSARHKDQSEPSWWYWSRRFVAAEDTLAQWIMAIFTAIAVALLWITLSLTRGTLREAKEATRAAQDAVTVTREMGEAQVRAYVHVEHFGASGFSTDGPPRVTYVLRNSGSSPAKDVQINLVTFAAQDGNKCMVRLIPTNRNRRSILTVSAGSALPQKAEVGVDSEGRAIEILKNTGAVLVFAGYVRYRDVFGRRHGQTFKAFAPFRGLAVGDDDFTMASKNNYST